MQIKLTFTREVVYLASFWKWGFLELGSGLLRPLCGPCVKDIPRKKLNNIFNCIELWREEGRWRLWICMRPSSTNAVNRLTRHAASWDILRMWWAQLRPYKHINCIHLHDYDIWKNLCFLFSFHFGCLLVFLTKYLNLSSALLSVSFQHFNFKGNTLLGLKVAATLRNLLSKAKPRGSSFRELFQACVPNMFLMGTY